MPKRQHFKAMDPRHVKVDDEKVDVTTGKNAERLDATISFVNVEEHAGIGCRLVESDPSLGSGGG